MAGGFVEKSRKVNKGRLRGKEMSHPIVKIFKNKFTYACLKQ